MSTYPTSSVTLGGLKNFFQRFIRWHYKLSGAGSLYCCSGIPDKSTKETQKDWSKLLSDISNSLNEGEICENRFDIQINYDEIFTGAENPFFQFSENCRTAQFKNELDERFLHFYW